MGQYRFSSVPVLLFYFRSFFKPPNLQSEIANQWYQMMCLILSLPVNVEREIQD